MPGSPDAHREIAVGPHVARNALAAVNSNVAVKDGGSLIEWAVEDWLDAISPVTARELVLGALVLPLVLSAQAPDGTRFLLRFGCEQPLNFGHRVFGRPRNRELVVGSDDSWSGIAAGREDFRERMAMLVLVDQRFVARHEQVMRGFG